MIDPDKIMADHQPWLTASDGTKFCGEDRCSEYGDRWPCLPYRLAAENAALRAAIGRVEALAARWLDATQDGQGVKREHWRGADFVDGQDHGREVCAQELSAALALPGHGLCICRSGRNQFGTWFTPLPDCPSHGHRLPALPEGEQSAAECAGTQRLEAENAALRAAIKRAGARWALEPEGEQSAAEWWVQHDLRSKGER